MTLGKSLGPWWLHSLPVKLGWIAFPYSEHYETLEDSESFPATLVTGSRWRNLQNILGAQFII